MLSDRYGKMITDIRTWRQQFCSFAEHLTDWGCQHKNLVAIFDCHFQQTCRPGGDSCKSVNLWDFQTFAGKELLHGLKFQAGVMPNGLALCWGPWQGTQHDVTMFSETGVLDALEEISEEDWEDYSGYGDSAYPLSWYMSCILKPAAEQSLS